MESFNEVIFNNMFRFKIKDLLIELHLFFWSIFKVTKKLPEGWFYDSEILEYRRLLNQLPAGATICELGVYRGRSICSVSDIIKRKKLKVISVDTFQGTGKDDGLYEETKEIDLKKVFEESLGRFKISSEIYKMTSHEASRLIEAVDLLFIDADHTYEAVKQDIDDWLPKVKMIISGHDYGNRECPGVASAVNEKFGENNVILAKRGLVWSVDLRKTN